MTDILQPALDLLPDLDSPGYTALVLVEAMLHALLENGAMTIPQAISAVEVASEVTIDLIEQSDQPDHRLNRSLGLLKQIKLSLETDLLARG